LTNSQKIAKKTQKFRAIFEHTGGGGEITEISEILNRNFKTLATTPS
jgi:hypothetical protein